MSDAPAPPSSPPSSSTPAPPAYDDNPAYVLPVEAARAALQHWWREPLAGILALGIGTYDSWYFGHDNGLSSALDEILVIGGVVLIAGSKHLFTGTLPGSQSGNAGNKGE